MKCESGSSHFQPGEDPSSGLLSVSEPSFEALIATHFAARMIQTAISYSLRAAAASHTSLSCILFIVET